MINTTVASFIFNINHIYLCLTKLDSTIVYFDRNNDIVALRNKSNKVLRAYTMYILKFFFYSGATHETAFS